MEYFRDYTPETENIVDSIQKNQLALFCGSGATADATDATWTELFKQELKVIDKDVSNYYRLAEYYQLHYGKNKLINAVTNIFSNKKESIHIQHLLQLPIYEFWTTNFDRIIEDMIADKTNIIPAVIYNSENLIKINENTKYKIFKMNGSITDIGSMVLTSSDYEKYEQTQAPFIEFLKRALILNTFLFIGYSFEDNLVLKCLADNKKYFSSIRHYHYRFAKKEKEHKIFQEIEQKYFENNYNIKTIFVNTYDEIDAFIEHVYKKYKSKNVYISGSFRNLDSNEEDYANMLCKELVEKLLDGGYNIYSGDGKRLGSYIISNATKKLISGNDFNRGRLTIMPYIDHTFKSKRADDSDRIKLVQDMIKDCSVSIFLYGQSEDGGSSNGVLVEYQEAHNKKMLTIPIPTTGFAAKQIYSEMKLRGLPGYLEKYTEAMETEKDPVRIVKVIMEIININNR